MDNISLIREKRRVRLAAGLPRRPSSMRKFWLSETANFRNGRRESSSVLARSPLFFFAMEYHKNSEGRERGYHQRGDQFPGGGLSPADGRGGGAGLGLASRGGGRGCQVTLQPRLPWRVESPGATGAGHDVTWWGQATGQQPTPLRAPSTAPDAGRLWKPPYIN